MAGKNKSSKKAKAKVAAKKKIYQVEKDKEPKKKSDQEDRTNREEEVPCEEEKNVGDDESVSLERQKETPDPLDECPELIPGSAVTSEDVKAEAKVEKDVNMNLAKQLNRMTDTTTENMDGKGSNAAVTHCTETPTKPFAHSILSPNAKPFSLKPTPQVVEITTVSPAADEDGGVMEAGSKVAKIVKTTVPATRYLDTKHPLRYKWTLWHFFHYPNTNWEDNQRMVLAVEYVEDFFGLLNWVKSCSELGHGHEYSFFKEDIKPMWEDHSNRNGGRWTCNIECNRNGLSPEEAAATDERWMELLMAMVGDTVTQSYGYMVNGAVFSARKTFKRTSVWLNQTDNTEGILAVGKHVKNLLKIPSNVAFGFESHRASMVKTSSSKFMLRI